MRAVKGKDTAPELLVRRMLRAMGHSGYRLHRKDIPGKPDIAWIGRKRAIFINGCFWHGHECARGARMPKTREAYWRGKIERTKHRDAAHIEKLESEGWRVMTLWECELRDREVVEMRLREFMD